MDNALKLIGLMRKANKISLTEQKCKEDIKSGKSELILFASDCSETVREKIRTLSEIHHVSYITCEYSKYDLASAAGSGLCSVISINDKGFSEAILKLINA